MKMRDDLKHSALDYHRYPVPGKIEITATKPLATQRDLALAYTPGAPTTPIRSTTSYVFRLCSAARLMSVPQRLMRR